MRGLTLCVVGFLWYLSIIWSADGFSINDPDLRWIGVGLALSITVVQLVFNRGSANPTIFLVGLAAYMYGFATNFLGISEVIGLQFTSANFAENPLGFVASGLGVVALSLIVEAAPESFLLWALYPKEQSPGDFISTLFRGITLPKNGRSKPFSERSEPKQTFNRSQGVQMNGTEGKVFSYIERFRSQNNGKDPSYAQVVQNTPLKSKGAVKSYFDKLNTLKRSI